MEETCCICTICNKWVFVGDCRSDNLWHGCYNKEDSHYFKSDGKYYTLDDYLANNKKGDTDAN